MSILSCFLKSLSNRSWNQSVLLNTEYLGKFKRCSSHFTQLITDFIGNLLISSILLVWILY